MYQKVAGSIPSQGTCLGCGSVPTCEKQATEFLSHIGLDAGIFCSPRAVLLLSCGRTPLEEFLALTL